jgi:hypothetical protein
MSDTSWNVEDRSEGRITQQPSDGATLQRLEYSLSWTAYPRLFLRLLFRLFIFSLVFAAVVWIFKINKSGVGANIGLFLTWAVGIAMTLYDFIYLKTMKLQIDREGVWLKEGVFPWNKGFSGSRWDQIGDASMRQNFASWLCKSYDISVSHQFTTGQEIALAHVKDGDVAVQSINRMLSVSRQHR